ncbi:hypothetical protein A2125_00850 [Candidatus Woesebacteria bacterium GWB1_43_5]|uniref:HTH cro/C1-type domain-containing protein n=1 Tax=Candidatus Woesebacteria bacterium GWB1_43_5 TaxID=1802474 RepID=A0A1F7WTQ9_9BACT|nr:MAG: hypothetical protein A2125_00850 [Candidatus Woesebacteria bacterium GWB1_43_5]
MEDNSNNIKNRIRDLLAGKKQIELARFCGVTTVTVNNWTHNLVVPTRANRKKICEFLKLKHSNIFYL